MSWKSLDEIYLKESANKKVDLLPRQKVNVFFEDNNLFRGEGDNYEFVGAVDDKDYRKIVNIVKKEGDKSIEKLVQQSGFVGQTRYVKNFLADFDVNYGEVEILSQIKQKLNSITGSIGGSQGELSLHQAIFPVLEKILANETREKIEQFYNSLFVKSFAEGNVSVGDGELLLSLFTECFKGDVGDLKTPSGLNIELKVGKGRIISARGGGFKNDLDKLKEFAQKPDLSIEDLQEAKFTGDVMKKAFANISILQQFIDQNITDPNQRMQHFAGIMLNEYGKEGFDIVMFVYQKGFTRKAGEFMGDGTFDKTRYLNVTNYSNILNAINNNFIAFDFDGDGVYIGYPGSNVNAKFKKDLKLS
jgi:hypothetical protein